MREEQGDEGGVSVDHRKYAACRRSAPILWSGPEFTPAVHGNIPHSLIHRPCNQSQILLGKKFF